ncbi:3-oxo-tetronate kinase [Arthrobacter sp. NPDC056886]|uniref:3-oxo-tetronate kinase n=1 Tax=Arthrobacter sp. NPDC056886 TaxID=3345960 RepID=UPI00366FC81B
MPQWGCIADDFTGATDLATNFVAQGFRTTVIFGAPDPVRPGTQDDPAIDVVVVALKTRTAPVEQAVSESLLSLRYLESIGAQRIYVKYCSTFDSTPTGNIGPVIDAVLAELDEAATVVVPSFPQAARTVYRGHLFVGSDLLSESSMRHHPLTPMLDSSVPRMLSLQSVNHVGLVPLDVVRAGAVALRDRVVPGAGRTLLVVDAISECDLTTIAEATNGLRVVTGGSGLARGYEHDAGSADARDIRVADGYRATLCGSASQATRAQVAHAKQSVPWRKLDLHALRDGFDAEIASLLDWAAGVYEDRADATPLFYSVDSLADTENVPAGTSELVEQALAAIAAGLVRLGARRLIVAGGETSGRVVSELGIDSITIGAAIAPGVAWSAGRTADGVPVNVALKSGNFGAEDMFTSAWAVLA